MKRKCLILLQVVCIFLIFALSACNKINNRDDENVAHKGIVNENTVIDMFTQYAQRDTDGSYRFRDYRNLSNISYLYNFVYSPSYKMYNCNILVTSYTGVKLYDYAAITFSWGKLKQGLFYAYHELDSIAKIEFEFSNIKFDDNRLGNGYTYNVTSNSFVNLTSKNDIDEYATRAYDCLEQTVIFLNSVFFSHNISTDLW